MDINDYTDKARTTAHYMKKFNSRRKQIGKLLKDDVHFIQDIDWGDIQYEHELSYLGLGLASEAGEVASAIKKCLRDEDYTFEHLIYVLTDELGDVLWYVAMLANALNIDLDSVMKENLEKLKSRGGGHVTT